MKISDMISQLQLLQGDIGDVEVLISDGYRGYFYRGNYKLERYSMNGEVFVDIAIGNCMEDFDGS